MNDTTDIERYGANLHDALEGAGLCNIFAQAEGDPVRKDLFLQCPRAETWHRRGGKDLQAAFPMRTAGWCRNLRWRGASWAPARRSASPCRNRLAPA